jgi:hypothetical protein
MKGEQYSALIQKDDPSMEIVNIKADLKSSTNTELVVSVHWLKEQEHHDIDSIPCNNTPSETCLVLYRTQIADDVLHHDCNVHKGARSCAIVGR